MLTKLARKSRAQKKRVIRNQRGARIARNLALLLRSYFCFSCHIFVMFPTPLISFPFYSRAGTLTTYSGSSKIKIC